MNKPYKRESYLRKIRPFYNSDVIKVITGIRRCGKSCLLQLIIDELLDRGTASKDIIDINLDKRGFKSIKTSEALEKAIESRISDSDFKYLFIDEIQNVKGFEGLINSYREDGGFSIFITGSNSYLLSGELITKLTGRYVEFEMYPLTFYEYLNMKAYLGKPQETLNKEFEDYLTFGGFPKALEYDDPEAKLSYVSSVVEQIIEKDVKGRQKIRNIDIFERVMTYVINNFGATTSVSNITRYFNDVEHISLKRDTVKRYLQVLENAKIISKCTRFDMKSKKSLGAEEKYYLSDPGIYFSRNTDHRINYGPVLENVLFIYLKTKGYTVSVGRIGKLECDFIARKSSDYSYIQVAMTIADPKTEEREYRPFGNIRDGYPRFLFTLDPLLQKRDGVTHLNLLNFISDNRNLDD